MIAQLTGLAGQIEADRCVIDVHGVGYLVHASTRTLSALPGPPDVTRVLVETVVREDAFLLYGFVDAAERDWFRLLTTVQGVGAKLALAILSALSPGDLAAIIAAADKTGLTRVSGVGARLAERILSELRGKAGKLPVGQGVVLPVQPASAGVEGDVLLALAGLGFRRAEAQPVVQRILARLKEAGAGHEADLDVVIRESLRELAR